MVKGTPVRDIRNKNTEELLGELKKLRVITSNNNRKNYKQSDLLKSPVQLLPRLPKLK
jgi:hypothetical protein